MDIKALLNEPPFAWPQGVGKEFLRLLNDRKAPEADRRLAAELAGDYTVLNDQLATALLKALADFTESLELRQEAALALGTIVEDMDILDPEEAEDALVSVMVFQKTLQALLDGYHASGTPDALRRACLEASVRAPRAWHKEAVQIAWNHPDQEWKHTGAYCMRYIKGFDREIVEGLESPDSVIRFSAVVAAGAWEVDDAAPSILRVLRSKRTDKELLMAAISAIASILPGDAGEILEDFLDSEDDDIAEAAEEAISFAEALEGGEDDEYDEVDDEYDEDDAELDEDGNELDEGEPSAEADPGKKGKA